MLQRLRKREGLARGRQPAQRAERTNTGFTALRLFSAELLLSTGASATLHYLRTRSQRRESQDSGETPLATGRSAPSSQRLPAGSAWVPLVLGSAACAVQTARVYSPSEGGERASRMLNGGVLGLGAVGVADTIAGAIRREQPFSVAPLLFAYAGLLGLLLDREEDRVSEHVAELERRARLVERLVPRRRPKLERIVVHV